MKCIGYDDSGRAFDCPNKAMSPWEVVCRECDRRCSEHLRSRGVVA